MGSQDRQPDRESGASASSGTNRPPFFTRKQIDEGSDDGSAVEYELSTTETDGHLVTTLTVTVRETMGGEGIDRTQLLKSPPPGFGRLLSLYRRLVSKRDPLGSMSGSGTPGDQTYGWLDGLIGPDAAAALRSAFRGQD